MSRNGASSTMKKKVCPNDNCESGVYRKEATEMPTQVSSDGKVRTVFYVRYCNSGHVLGYDDVQES